MLLVASVLSWVLLRLNGLKVGLRHPARRVILAIQHIQITELGAVWWLQSAHEFVLLFVVLSDWWWRHLVQKFLHGHCRVLGPFLGSVRRISCWLLAHPQFKGPMRALLRRIGAPAYVQALQMLLQVLGCIVEEERLGLLLAVLAISVPQRQLLGILEFLFWVFIVLGWLVKW